MSQRGDTAVKPLLGFININKPKGVTSHDVVHRVRKALNIKQVGHGGTLDPMAEGVLPIAIGSACRFLRFLPHNKIYVAELLLGTRTTTDDVEGDVIEQISATEIIALAEIEIALTGFIGNIKQKPPVYSAIHHQGKRLYELARAGNIPEEIRDRDVTVDSITILDYQYPVLKLRIVCGSGTYIRSIARDLGDKLKIGGCLQALIREQSGPFSLSDAIEIPRDISRDDLTRVVIAPQMVLAQSPELELLDISSTETKSLRMGQRLPVTSDRLVTASVGNQVLAVFDGSLIALCKLESDQEVDFDEIVPVGQLLERRWKLKPEVVVPNAE